MDKYHTMVNLKDVMLCERKPTQQSAYTIPLQKVLEWATLIYGERTIVGSGCFLGGMTGQGHEELPERMEMSLAS